MNRKSLITISWITFFIGTVIFVFFTPVKTFQNYLLTMLISALYSFTIAIGNGVVNDYLNKRYSWVEDTKKRTILGVISTVIVNVILVFICNYINFILFQKGNVSEFFSGNMGFFNWFTINVALFISAVLHAKGFVEAWKSSTKQEVVQQKLIAKSANAQFESLKNQLDPHFLFNSLNVLSSLIDENPAQAQRFTASMSKIYRYVLEQKDKELVTVEEELNFAKTYCDLLKTRFEDSVSFDFNVNEKDLKFYVVPLSLQLLLENCIKHNFATSSKPLHIKIYSENGNLFIENNLQQREQVKESAGIGLSNIVQRYSLLTKQNVFIEKSATFFKVKIPILTQKITAMNTQPSSESMAYERASKRVKDLKGFYSSLISYCLVIPFLIFINLRTAPEYHWFWWPMFGWGLGLSLTAIKVFGISNNWEEKQIQKILDRDKYKN
ncbi:MULTISPECIES: 2TM domain-containing protein [unclassified Kaistella]|uniref:2TM domain-containing protein n=1 Tax=unclassified Kaistella TaxID=2762626 RepID=UPI0027372B16|nr:MULTISPECIES: 2TM domain-containing protein [unclassified Kaistella]MDP2452983.1 2TM domain-containing protein [Kaistella sp. SH11-4b]MDP2455892.1 2TM domain-containing protein [Kaistella sp. SH40-3]MDP2458796.1 2TM domain-containing protein [Kaistella sp. SH19-2b]